MAERIKNTKAVTMIVAIPMVIDVYIVALLAVVIVPKADSAPISVAKIVRKAVVIVRMAVVNAIVHPLAGTKYSIRMTNKNCKG